MPTYDYRCEDCGHIFEAFHGIKDDPLSTCPECGEDALERLIAGGGGIIFKGSGFYETDYKKRGSSGGGQNNPGNSSEGSDSSSGNGSDSD